ncbi:MAG: flavodoxin family protein [Spirochaetota bacterium]
MTSEAGNVTRALIVYSTQTGNTEYLARGVHRLLGQGADATSTTVADIRDEPDPAPFDAVLLAFWVNRGTADDQTLAYIDRLSGARVGLLGTLGAYPDSQHARDVEQRVRALVSERNTVLGCFLCQGRIDPRLTERFKSLPADHPHAMTPERVKRHLDASSHPDEHDVANAVSACRRMLAMEGAR